jgi:L-seryl-tRNA(Ser) seleniumtransferase
VTSYERLGVKRAVNCMGAVTFLGGAPLHPAVVEAMQAAAARKVDLNELHVAAGRRIAELTGTEAAFVTSGAAAGFALSAAACLTGTDVARIARLPEIHGQKSEIVIHRKHRSNFDHAVRSTGVRLVEFGYSRDRTEVWELEDAICERTAAVAYIANFGNDSVLPLEEVVHVAHAHGLPVFVDAAVSLPPVANLRALPATGADLCAFSGGKAIGGPQNTGFVAGRADLVAACAANTNPNHNTIGRPFKVNCEAIVGLVTALELYVEHDEAAERAAWISVLEAVRDAAALAEGVDCELLPTTYHGMPIPALRIPVDGAAAIAAELAAGDPGVWVAVDGPALVVNPHALVADDADLVGGRIREALDRARPV